MKKILSLFTMLMLFVSGANAEEVVYALNEGDTFSSGESIDVKDTGGETVAIITSGESGGNAFNAEVADVLTWEGLGLDGSTTSYGNFADKTFASSAVYAGNASSGKGLYIQLRSSNNNAGIVTTTSGGNLKSVAIEWNEKTTDRVLCIYGKNEAYSSASDLYGDDAGTLLGEIAANDENKTLTVDGSYSYLGIRSKSGAQ